MIIIRLTNMSKTHGSDVTGPVHVELGLLHTTEDRSGVQELANIQHVRGLNVAFHSSVNLLARVQNPFPVGPLHQCRDNP